MVENDIAAEILKRTRAGLPGAVVVKHNDVGTSGIPDIQVARANLTSWAELKFLKPGRTLRGVNKSQQLLFCHELAVVNNGRCWVLVYETTRKHYRTRDTDPGVERVTVWQPRALFRHLWPNVAGPDPEHPKWNRLGVEPLQVDAWNLPRGIVPSLMTHGAVRGPWDYDIVAYLVREATGGR